MRAFTLLLACLSCSVAAAEVHKIGLYQYRIDSVSSTAGITTLTFTMRNYGDLLQSPKTPAIHAVGTPTEFGNAREGKELKPHPDNKNVSVPARTTKQFTLKYYGKGNQVWFFGSSFEPSWIKVDY